MQKSLVHLDKIQTKIKERQAELLAMDKVTYHKCTKVHQLQNNSWNNSINHKLQVCVHRICVLMLSTILIPEWLSLLYLKTGNKGTKKLTLHYSWQISLCTSGVIKFTSAWNYQSEQLYENKLYQRLDYYNRK